MPAAAFGAAGGHRGEAADRTVDRRRFSIGELYLMVSSCAAAAFAGLLAFAPARVTTGPSLTLVYSLADRSTWAMGYAVLALLCAFGAWRPTESRFVVIVTAVVLCQALWAIGLTMPAFIKDGATNLLAVVAWVQLAGTYAIVAMARRRPVLPPQASRGRARPGRPVLPRRGHRPPVAG